MRFALKPTIVILLVFKSLLSAAQLKLQPSLAIGVGFRGGVIRLTDKPVITNNYGFNYIFGSATNYFTVDLQQKS